MSPDPTSNSQQGQVMLLQVAQDVVSLLKVAFWYSHMKISYKVSYKTFLKCNSKAVGGSYPKKLEMLEVGMLVVK